MVIQIVLSMLMWLFSTSLPHCVGPVRVVGQRQRAAEGRSEGTAQQLHSGQHIQRPRWDFYVDKSEWLLTLN